MVREGVGPTTLILMLGMGFSNGFHSMDFYLAGIYAIYHRNIVPGYLHLYAMLSFFAPLLLFNAVGWVGSLRSDYTKQLVRSHWHALRIIVMYALVLPVVCYTTASGVIDFIMRD